MSKSALSDDLFERLHAHLLPEQLVELSTAVALQNFSARFNRAFAIEPASGKG